MRELTEQESLARLVGKKSEVEEIDSADLLTQGLLKGMGGANPAFLNQVKREIESSGDAVDHAPVSRFVKQGEVSQEKASPKKDEKLINVLTVIHQGLIDVFERAGFNSGFENQLTPLIDATGACISYLGGSVEKFEPLKHLSGLEAPNMSENALKVIETTKRCYKLGKVVDSKLSDSDSNSILIIFSGEKNGVKYLAYGKISAKSWDGSEAIDYIYTSGAGQMSVKSYKNGKWVDVSSDSNYNIYWELEEVNEDEESDQVEGENEEVEVEEEEIEEDFNFEEYSTLIEEENEKKIINKKEESFVIANNEDDDEEIGDFPINSK